jgi:hypothetical protein
MESEHWPSPISGLICAQTQVPVVQTRPAGQVPQHPSEPHCFPPQLGTQLSQRAPPSSRQAPLLHAAHATPPEPHAAIVSPVWQAPPSPARQPWQQPLPPHAPPSHGVPSGSAETWHPPPAQTLDEQSLPLHAAHCVPPPPQCDGSCPDRHCAPLKQPTQHWWLSQIPVTPPSNWQAVPFGSPLLVT